MILVESETPKVAAPFNKQTNKQINLETGYNNFNGINPILDGYLVSKNGEIVFPILGKLKVSGLTHQELGVLIEEKLKSGQHITDPMVTVKLLNYKIYVMGEVARPGVVNVDNEKITILEALSAAGDLTIYGLRDNVTVVREHNGKRQIGNVDLTSKDLFSSPYYYLQQNDVIYVEPNNRRKRQGVQDLTALSAATSIASFFASLLSIIITVSK